MQVQLAAYARVLVEEFRSCEWVDERTESLIHIAATGMNNLLETSVQLPAQEKGFYLLQHFFYHEHDKQTADQIYVIPWENGVIFTSKRDPTTAGCVGCLVRRLIATTYHKSSKISGIDSIFYPDDITKSEDIAQCCKEVIEWEISATRCLFFRFDNSSIEELHILPVPACQCSKNPLPSIPSSFAEQWLLKWPNVILEKHNHCDEVKTFHIRSSRLPNSAPLFLQTPGDFLHVGSAPTAADFRDGKNLEMRLIGESIERYSSAYVPECFLQIAPYLIEPREQQVVQTENFFGETRSFPAGEVFGGFYRLAPAKFQPRSSSGVAAHKTLQEAKIAAALELLERDALLTAWRLADSSHFSPFFQIPTQLLQELREFEWTRRLAHEQSHEVQISGVKNQLNLPIVLICTIPQTGSTSSPNFGVGIGFSWQSAIRKALCEVLQGISVPDFALLDGLPKTFVERPRFWKLPERMQKLKNRLDAQEELPLEVFSKHHPFPQLVPLSVLREIFFANLTPGDVSLSGWHVVRALSSCFEPFPGDYQHERPSIERANQFLKSLNIEPVTATNNDPFPFP